jgi:uncharacterized protein (TIGR02996 family)
MRSFRYADDKSYKFWKIELEGSSYTVRFGRIGTKGQSKTKEYLDPQAARKAYDKIIAEKLAEGYVETTPPAQATGTESVLERAVMDDPDDLAAHSAYADWLDQEGDPRGEFIQVQLALEDAAHPADARKELKKRERALLKTHAGDWLGGLANFLVPWKDADEDSSGVPGGYEFQFARGWLDSIRVPEISVAFARALARAPQARLLRRLTIEGQVHEDADDYEPGDDIPEGSDNPTGSVLLRCPFLTNLRVFHLGEPMEGEYSNCHTSGETAAELVARMPRLEELYLLAHRVDMERLFALKNLTNLRVLQIYHNHNYPLEILAANPAFQNLTHVLFHPHALEPDDEGAYINLDGVTALVHSPHLRSLAHLQLRISDMGDDGCEAIVRSGILKRLKTLDLTLGRISDRGAEILAGCPDLRNLELLEVTNNRLSKAGIEALRRAGVAKVIAEGQYGPESDEMEYLWQGDME